MGDGDLAALLRRSWWRLRLSERNPGRAPPWDVILLTAASPRQAELFQWQLRRAKRMGRIAESTVTLAVSDPDGARIGSGAATCHALAKLAAHLARLGLVQEVLDEEKEHSNDLSEAESDLMPMSAMKFLAKSHILLLHAGGDSKRVPWANPMGKVFLPLPYLAADDPDAPVPLLFDHILAISSCARQAFNNEGGIFIMTGDVLPCFDASMMVIPTDSPCIVTVPITLDIASHHGVIVASETEHGNSCGKSSISLVENLLQKPSIKELIESNAVRSDGRALLDTGIVAVRGKAWMKLLLLARSSHTMTQELVRIKDEVSLYEDLVAAWVPARHEWLKTRPLGKKLLEGLAGPRLYSLCANDLIFLHFGTSSEVLDHLNGPNSSLVGRRHLSSMPGTTACDIAPSAIILSSRISTGVAIGDDSLVYDSELIGNIHIGPQSIVVGVNAEVHVGLSFVLPGRHCLWEVPLVGHRGRVIVFCGLHDNPKATVNGGGTFCGRPWRSVFSVLGFQEDELWASPSSTKIPSLWNARVFPIRSSYSEMLSMAMWLMGSSASVEPDYLTMWRESPRISLEELHCCIDFELLLMGSTNHQADIAAEIYRTCISYGLISHNLAQLSAEILQNEIAGVGICRDFLSLVPSLFAQSPCILPRSRAYQVQADMLATVGEDATAAEEEALAAIVSETAAAVKHDFGDLSTAAVSALRGKKARVELPVRIDFVGGWSDTPPWSLERPGCVLNMAVSLGGSLPVGADMEITEEFRGIHICDDLQNNLLIKDPSAITAPFGEDDPFRLVKSALIVTGMVKNKRVWGQCGMKIMTWAKVPRGSGLGTSSILAAAVAKGLLQLMEEDNSNDNVARIVLVIEQVMGTGGGWQDQIGGLYPGIKCTTSLPEQPLRLQISPLVASSKLVSELQHRLLLVFTGQVRLAHQVLQKVVIRYLRRDSMLISTIRRLAAMAKAGREALMSCDLDELGKIMSEAWRLHQELDPHCSNDLVDRLFCFADEYCSGYKLVGAGGGGFALLLAKDCFRAAELRRLLQESTDLGVRVYDWSIFLDQHIIVSPS
ncbi:L-fucokinase/GDP-L-fucose pyrophosphorylase isoform X2 [Wolffia australiana]